MNHERAELIDSIRATARAMDECAEKMRRYSERHSCAASFTHGIEMLGASKIAETWAKGLEE
jgi:hypothetical protein